MQRRIMGAAGEIDGRLFPLVLLLWGGAILYVRETERVRGNDGRLYSCSYYRPSRLWGVVCRGLGKMECIRAK
jgi:hypothetical protein